MKKPIVLAILDGYGFASRTEGNAIKKANTPCMDYLISNYPNVLLEASGEHVGLPKGQIGNSEVGHLNIGAGRIVYTGLSLINKDIADDKFKDNKVLNQAIDFVKQNNSKLHIMGLLSPGGVHSLENHIFEIIKAASLKNVKPIVHVFGDGRDVAPQSILESLKRLDDKLKQYGGTIGTISGRFYAMDRDKRFERTEAAYKALLGDTDNFYNDPFEYINQQYQQNITDEFLVSATKKDSNVYIKDNDAIIFANFRPDRARQLTHLFIGSSLYDVKPYKKLNNIYFATMMSYEGIEPNGILYPTVMLDNTIGKALEDNNLKQLRIAETEKYAHVTFFMDGGAEVNYKNEDKILIPSPKVATYDLAPKMSAVEITDKLLSVIDQYDVVILNYANADMIGHTGVFEKAVESIECLDKQIERLYQKVKELNGTLFITADHGNAEEMIDEKGNKVTKHTTNPVPLIVTDKNVKLVDSGNLSNISPTILEYLNMSIPKEMTSKSLLKSK